MSQNEELKECVREFFKILDSVEMSDNGNEFRPTYITSARTFHIMKLEKLLPKMKELANAPE